MAASIRVFCKQMFVIHKTPLLSKLLQGYTLAALIDTQRRSFRLQGELCCNLNVIFSLNCQEIRNASLPQGDPSSGNTVNSEYHACLPLPVS